MRTAKEMGMTVVRSHTLGISVGDPLSVCPTLDVLTSNQPNLTAFNTIDYAICTAAKLGLKLIIPLTDNYFYNGSGKHAGTGAGSPLTRRVRTGKQKSISFDEYRFMLFMLILCCFDAFFLSLSFFFLEE